MHYFRKFHYVTVTGNKLSGISRYIFGEYIGMNQIFKAFKVSVIKILEKDI